MAQGKVSLPMVKFSIGQLKGACSLITRHPLVALLLTTEAILCIALVNELINSAPGKKLYTQNLLSAFWYIFALVGFWGLGKVRQSLLCPPSFSFVCRVGLLMIFIDSLIGSAENAALASMAKDSHLKTLILSPLLEEVGRAGLIYSAPSLLSSMLHSLVFSFAHSDFVPTNSLHWFIRMYGLFLFSFSMYLVILRTGSVWNAILLHFLLNATEITISIGFIPRHAFIAISLITGSLIALRLAVHVNNFRQERGSGCGTSIK